MELFDLIVVLLGLYIIFRVAYRAWNKPTNPIDKTIQSAVEIEQDFQKVSKFEKDHGDLPEKVQKVNQFRKGGLK